MKLLTHLKTTVPNQVISILHEVSPMEPALERLVPSLSSNIVSYVIQQHRDPRQGFRFFIWATRKKRLRSRASDNLVIDMLVRDKHGFHLYWKTLQDLKNCRIPIASNAFTVLIAGYAKIGMAEKAVEAFSTMKDYDCKPDVLTYNCILNVMVRKGVFLLALAIYNNMLKSNCTTDSATYGILMNGLFKTGNTRDALKLFDEMIQRGILPNNRTYTISISGLCRAERPSEAHRLFNTMRESGCPDDITHNALLNGFCKLGRIDEAYALLRTFERDGYALGLHGYSSLIDSLFRAKRYTEAHSWFGKLLKEDVKPDLVLYSIMIRGLSDGGKVQEALKLLAEMTQRDLVPDTYCYNAVIKGFCDMGLLDEARSLQLEISKQDCFPNACTYTILICGMCRNGLVEEAQLMFNEMEKLGCVPSVVTFNALIDGLCKAGQIEEAHLLFYRMEIGRNPSIFLRLSQGANPVLDSASLQKMVDQLCDSGLILKAYRLLMRLADSSGAMPNITTYNALINGFCKTGNINGAFKLFKDMQLKGLSPDSITYGTLIDGLQRVDREEDAFGVFHQMEKNGVTPSLSVYKSLMTWSNRKGKVSLAFSLWLKYLKNLPGTEQEAIRAVEEYFDKGEVEKAIRGILEMDFKMNNFDLGPYTILLIGFCEVRKMTEAMTIFSILKEYKFIITAPSCAKLIHGLCQEGNLDLAINVFLYTLESGFIMSPRPFNQLLKCLLRSRYKKHVPSLVSRMKSFGYDLDVHLYPSTKFLLLSSGSWNTGDTENVSPG
ncbi:hypothetical protein I3760_15G091900 [Carya illinoinensis]|nr:hypothetical protein I3760_15G091900 [Carya illinoinensis]